uniref:Putative secreted protein n=1 Tax=Ixodes ricinus TaxID=34613 RepID=A0A6B0UIR7_IXORI
MPCPYFFFFLLLDHSANFLMPHRTHAESDMYSQFPFFSTAAISVAASIALARAPFDFPASCRDPSCCLISTWYNSLFSQKQQYLWRLRLLLPELLSISRPPVVTHHVV